MVISVYELIEGGKRGEDWVNEEQLSSGEKRMINTFLLYNQKQLKKLEENNGDIILINKVKDNIQLYIKQLKELE